MIDHFFILLSTVSEYLKPLGSCHGSIQQLSSCSLLQCVLLVTEEELPFVEAIRKIGLLMLLSVSDEVKPVLDDPAECYEAPPPVKALRLQVVICAIVAFPSANCFRKELTRFYGGIVDNIFDLMLSESLFLHEVLQIGIVELLIKNILGNWPDLVDFNDSGH